MLAVTLHCFFGCQDQWRQARQRFGQFQEGMLPEREKHSKSVKNSLKSQREVHIHTALSIPRYRKQCKYYQ